MRCATVLSGASVAIASVSAPATPSANTIGAPEKIRTSYYYDVVNFARRVKVPGFYSWGFNDEVCPPTSMYAAYNVIPGPKQLLLAIETGHNTTPEQTERVNRWLENLLKATGQ